MDRPSDGGLCLELHAGRLVELLTAGLPDVEEFALGKAMLCAKKTAGND